MLLVGCTGGAAQDPSVGADRPAAPGQQAVAASPGARGTLQWAVREPVGITPSSALGEDDLMIVDLLFDSLTAQTADGGVVPALAESWRSSGNARVWTFTLAPAVFHDGTPVTAGDVARGWEAAVQAGRPHLHMVEGYDAVRDGRSTRLRGVTVVDRRTLRVRLSEPDVTLPMVVSHPSLGPVQAEWRTPEYARQPVGNGPFEMAEPWARGRFVRLRRVTPAHSGPFSDAADDERDVREVVFRTADPPTSFVRFQQGRVDVAPVPGGSLPDATSLFGSAPDGSAQPGVHTDPRPGLVYLGMDTRGPPFDDVEVRRALSQAIDRAELAATVAEGNVDATAALVPPAVPGHVPGTCTACAHDPAAARAVFADRGIDRLQLTSEGGPGDQLLVSRLREDLAAVGVELVTRPLAFAELLETLEAGDADLYAFGWMTEVPDPGAAVAPLVSGEPRAGVNVNYGGYRDDEVDRLLRAARTSHDARRRGRLVRAAEEIALGRDQAVIPLYTTNARLAVADGVQGLQLSAFGSMTLEGVRLR